MAAALVILCVPAAGAQGQHRNAPAPPRASAPANRPAPAYRANRPSEQLRGRPQANLAQRPGSGSVATGPLRGQARPAYPGPPYLGPGFSRPAYQGYSAPAEAPPGHLGDWLNRHRGIPVEEQERVLRGDPGFHRLAPGDQQRVIEQLHQVNQLTEQQRQRRLARAEIIEHLAPQDRMRINLSARRWAELPIDRQAQMKTAFRDLREVPLDQRETVLNSARYQGAFSPEERGILSDMLRVEPYEPAR
jgi:hypothetical protein